MLGIAIINYKTYEKTIDCVNSIFNTVKSEYKIYLVDNASQNGSYEKLCEQFQQDSRVKLIQSDENLGYARGNNLCIDYAKRDGCDYILISNNDILYNENTVDSLLERLKAEGCLIVSPKILGIDNKQQASVKAFKPSFKEYLLFSNYFFGNLVSKRKRLEYQKKMTPSKGREVYWTSGACFMADMKQLEDIGFFDPYTFLFFEEYIISEKARIHGMRIVYCPEVSVIHYHGASMGGSANLFTRLESFKSESYMFSNYWVISKAKLKLVALGRSLEVLYTFTKEGQAGNAFKYIKEIRKILKTTPRIEYED